MTNKLPEHNLNLLQKTVLAAEAVFYRLFPATKKTYNTQIRRVASTEVPSLAPLPESTDMNALYEQNSMSKTTPSEPSSLTLPEFLEDEKRANQLGKPLTEKDVQLIRRVHTGLADTPKETITIPNPNRNSTEVLSA